MAERIKKFVQTTHHGSTLLAFMRSEFGLNARHSCKLIEGGKVTITGSLAAKGLMSNPLFNLSSGDIVQLDLDKNKIVKHAPKMKILYKDDHILAIRKPSGLAVHGGSKLNVSIEACIQEYQFEKEEPPRLVHRLDKDTSGVLLLARTKEMAQMLSKYFSEPEKYLKKLYLAMLLPNEENTTVPEKECGIVHRIDTGIFTFTENGKDMQRITKWDPKDPITNTGQKIERAITDYCYLGSTKHLVRLDILKRKGTMALFSPITGRKHQIRVHAAQYLKRAIVGDYKYGYGIAKKIKRSLPAKFPMMLHLRSILIKDYFGKELKITAPLSTEFHRCANSTGMGKYKDMKWPDEKENEEKNI